jgi:hypothetical protein
MKAVVITKESLEKSCDLYEAHKQKCGGLPLKKRAPKGAGPGCRFREIDWREFKRRPCTCGLKDSLYPPKKKKKRTMVQISAVRKAVADYMRNIGCSCCENTKKKEAAEKRIARLLNVPMYDDKSGYDFNRFQTEE